MLPPDLIVLPSDLIVLPSDLIVLPSGLIVLPSGLIVLPSDLIVLTSADRILRPLVVVITAALVLEIGTPGTQAAALHSEW